MSAWKKPLLNLLLYTAVVLGLLFLYYPFNNNPANRANSSIQFVYQNF